MATTLRQEEICKPEWPLVDMKKRLVVIQDRKDPRNKEGNDQKVPLLNLTGYDAWEVVLQQRIVTRGYGRIFPHNHRSVSAAFNVDLVRAGPNLIDYVIAHELAHAFHGDHSEDWRNLLSSVMPDWEERKLRLETTLR